MYIRWSQVYILYNNIHNCNVSTVNHTLSPSIVLLADKKYYIFTWIVLSK